MEIILDVLANYYTSVTVVCIAVAVFMLAIGFFLLSSDVLIRGTALSIALISTFLVSLLIFSLSFYATTMVREVKLELKAVNFSNVSVENEKVEYKQNHYLVFKKGTVSSTKTKTEKTYIKVFVGTKNEGYAFQNIPIERVRFAPIKKGEKPFVTIRASMEVQKECGKSLGSCEAVIKLNMPEDIFPPEKFSVPTIEEVGN